MLSLTRQLPQQILIILQHLKTPWLRRFKPGVTPQYVVPIKTSASSKVISGLHKVLKESKNRQHLPRCYECVDPGHFSYDCSRIYILWWL